MFDTNVHQLQQPRNLAASRTDGRTEDRWTDRQTDANAAAIVEDSLHSDHDNAMMCITSEPPAVTATPRARFESAGGGGAGGGLWLTLALRCTSSHRSGSQRRVTRQRRDKGQFH
ncbi:hypothetical protein CRUP_006040 [Coryphaenoides rupestris]|nr:hypothetical protein CRUP_006040 [Coryphaenoides rupestris]